MMNDHLTSLNVYLANNKDLSLAEALESTHALLGEAIKKYKEQPKKPPKLWLTNPVTLHWDDKKYRSRLNEVFINNDVNSTDFPWWEVIRLLLQLLRFLLTRA